MCDTQTPQISAKISRPRRNNDITNFIKTYCSFDKSYVERDFDLYNFYSMVISEPVSKNTFRSFVARTFSLTRPKRCEWGRKTLMTWEGIKINHSEIGSGNTLIQALMKEYVSIACTIGENEKIKTRLLNDDFERYAASKGYDTIMRNGFSRENFNTDIQMLFQVTRNTYNYLGITLKNIEPLDIQPIIKTFVDTYCVANEGLQVKGYVAYIAFCNFTTKQHNIRFNQTQFYEEMKELYPCYPWIFVTPNDKGFDGLGLK